MTLDGYGSTEHLRSRTRRSTPSNRTDDSLVLTDNAPAFYTPGQPIGFLRACGTVYEKKYLSRKLGYCCIFIAPIALIVSLVIGLFPVLYAVATHTLNVAVLHVEQSNITQPTNTSFPITLQGQATKLGIFPARLVFNEPIQVWWAKPPKPGQKPSPETLEEVNLGQLKLDSISAAAGHSRIKQATNFEIHDEQAFGEFTRFLITQPSFTWKLNTTKVHVEAFNFLPLYTDLTFTKHLNLKGFNNFEGAQLLDFQLPGPDPAGGISLQATAALYNPSPFGFQLGTLDVALYYQNMYLGPASTSDLNLTSGLNVVTLNGRLVPYNDNATALDALGKLFTGYINGDTLSASARGVSARQNNGDVISWLSAGIEVMNLNIPLKSPVPINPIKAIDIKMLSLVYTPETAYNPTTFSNAVSAQLSLPFGFPLDVVNAANTLTILFQGAQVGTVNSAFSNTTAALRVISATETTGTLDITLPPSSLTLANTTEAAKRELEHFTAYLTMTKGADIQLQGAAKVVTDTPLGRVLLDGILFEVDSGLLGVQGLNSQPTVISRVDATGGTKQGIELSVGVTLFNPSNLNLTVGAAHFHIVNQDVLGVATISGLTLNPGRNDLNATAVFDANSSPYGLTTLNRFISGLDTDVRIRGFDGSTDIASLVPALSQIDVPSTLPGLKSSLIKSANLTVLQSTGIEDNIADGTVFLDNPFSSPLTLKRIRSNVTSHGIFVASIDAEIDFLAQGHAVTSSPPIPLNLNLYPPDLFGLVHALAIQSGQDPLLIEGLVQLGGYTMTPSTTANSRRSLSDTIMHETNITDEASGITALDTNWFDKRGNIYTGFDLPSYVSKCFSVATANLEAIAEASLGDYTTSLTLAQNDVPLGTDVTLNRLLPVLAKPIVQKIVDGAVLNIDRATILNPQQNRFQTALQGTITGTGPFDATIRFGSGLEVFWNGRLLGQIAMPDVALVADVGATLEVIADFVVADVEYLTTFTKYLLTEKSFVWNVAGSNITAVALGIEIEGVTISKNVILSAFDGLKNSVIINSFDLPSNDPAGGIHLTAVSTIYNPAQVGIQLSRFGVNLLANGTALGPGAAAEPFVLQALAVTTLPLEGRLAPQTTEQGLAVLSTIFGNFINDINSEISVQGDYAGPADVTWLNEGIKIFDVKVSLPSQKFTLIRTISINQIALYFTQETAWTPSTSSNETQAQFFLPFAFPLDIVEAGGNFIANYDNKDMAQLAVPLSPSTTDVMTRILTLMFVQVGFDVYSDAHSTFSQFVADATAGTQVTFNLHGVADTKVQTAAGTVALSGVKFDVDTNLLGLQNLNARPTTISDLDVFHGFPSYVQINANAELFNPSHITIGAGDVTFDVIFLGAKVGTAVINALVLVPGVNKIATQVRYSPQGAANVATGQKLLQNYIQGVISTVQIQGSSSTTPIASLQQGLSGVTLQAALPPLTELLVSRARLFIPPNIAQTGIAQANVDIRNPFTASISLLKVKAGASYAGILLGTIDQDLSRNPIQAPGHATTTSRLIPLNLNLDPKNLIRFVLAAAAATNTDYGPLRPLFQQVLDQPSTKTTISPYPDANQPNCHSGQQFDAIGAVLKTVQGLATTLNLSSTDKLDDYQLNLDFVQEPVPTETDNSVLYLLGPAGAPIVLNLVNAAQLTVKLATATNVTNSGFDVSLSASIADIGPLDAQIEFPNPLTVTWQGRDIATLSLPPICAFANIGVPDLQTTGRLTITNQGAFTDFATFLLKSPNFQWTISSPNITARALGITFSNVPFSKTLDFSGFNGLPGVAASNFDVYGDTSNSLLIRTSASIPNPSTIGIQLDTANFVIFFMGTNIGPVHSTDLFLPAKATSNATLEGAITAKSGNDLKNTGILFSNFLQGKTQIIQVRGDSVVTRANGNQPVRWLSAAFRTLTLDVALPGHIYKIIYAITISDFTVFVQGDPSQSYVVPTSSNSTMVTFANPFNFGLQPLSAAPSIQISYQGGNAASLALPSVPVQAGISHGPMDIQALQLAWRRQNLIAGDHANFQAFLAQLTDRDRGTFDMIGSADIVARTAIGDVFITGVPFRVTTTLSGVNSFNGVATLTDPRATSGSNAFIFLTITVTLTNPSNLTVFSDEVFLPSLFRNTVVGRAELPSIGLIPGENRLKANFYYAPANANDSTAQQLITQYIQPSLSDGTSPQSSPLIIDGTAGPQGNLTAYDSLRPALAGVKLSTALEGIALRLITEVDVFLTGQTIATGLANLLTGGAVLPEADLQVTVTNGIPTNLFLVSLQGSAKVAGSQPRDASNPDARVSYTFASPLGVAAGGTVKTPRIPGVVLPKGLIASLGVIGKNVDLYTSLGVRIGQTAGDSYFAPGLNYAQLDVKSLYFLDIGGLIIPIPSEISSITDLLGLITGHGLDLGSVLPGIAGLLTQAKDGNIIAGLNSAGKQIVCDLTKGLNTLSAGLLGGILNDANCPGAPGTSSASATMSSTTATSASGSSPAAPLSAGAAAASTRIASLTAAPAASVNALTASTTVPPPATVAAASSTRQVVPFLTLR
ncbi:hypothetical protein EX895_004231 [Sporisorium graminicola]|uniref:Uncharacterized protein n=1 Tax=Sporisorium graminicola TaxID=280036 RepID=A0A4U7KRH6_9BASI|nr:hypothetical protein EX895_004231 [Sporisorium graminicola]TKY86943.1 hypothetical protein EX895_004231 [Sporisorium graminicola]